MGKLIRSAKILALLSFLIGSGIMLTYVLIPDGSGLLLTGFYFTYGMVLLNLLMVVILLAGLIWNRVLWKEVLKAIALMCLNIPVAILYICFVFYLLDTMRITFVNDRNAVLTNITIDGCEQKTIDRLEPGESLTKWIEIKGDCSIHILYDIQGMQGSETVEDDLC
ncbi:MAG: hypothetical protein JST76_12915, partial [Bacteroidetes bacterium]|nr:hypothetical protein [Bacteroidota bacterium]